MHRAINIKHRIVRRVDIDVAPLATFDTIDLGDEDVDLNGSNLNGTEEGKEKADFGSTDTLTNEDSPVTADKLGCHTEAVSRNADRKTGTIGGNTSKRSPSHAGGEKTQVDKSGHDVTVQQAAHCDDDNASDSQPSQTPAECSEQPSWGSEQPKTGAQSDLASKPSASTPCQTAVGPSTEPRPSLGRVKLPTKQPDPDSSTTASSSSSESLNDGTRTFQASRLPAGHFELASSSPRRKWSEGYEQEESDKHDSLVPDNIDPSQILSPSKRKAYERRIERLKVTTSPIARPRSTTPISVVTLNEYASLNSPDASPASPSILQDKLKITLPTDEFPTRPKTPRQQRSGKRRSSEETVFLFSEENLFSHSKSALVVEEAGHNPISPRRVLLPPSVTPTSSPKLSSGPRLAKSPGPESVPPTLCLLQSKKEDSSPHKFFGETVDDLEDNWASFPEPSPTIEAPPSAFGVALDQDIPTADEDYRQREDKKLTEDTDIKDSEISSDRTTVQTKEVDIEEREIKDNVCSQNANQSNILGEVSTNLIEDTSKYGVYDLPLAAPDFPNPTNNDFSSSTEAAVDNPLPCADEPNTSVITTPYSENLDLSESQGTAKPNISQTKEACDQDSRHTSSQLSEFYLEGAETEISSTHKSNTDPVLSACCLNVCKDEPLSDKTAANTLQSGSEDDLINDLSGLEIKCDVLNSVDKLSSTSRALEHVLGCEDENILKSCVDGNSKVTLGTQTVEGEVSLAVDSSSLSSPPRETESSGLTSSYVNRNECEYVQPKTENSQPELASEQCMSTALEHTPSDLTSHDLSTSDRATVTTSLESKDNQSGYLDTIVDKILLNCLGQTPSPEANPAQTPPVHIPPSVDNTTDTPCPNSENILPSLDSQGTLVPDLDATPSHFIGSNTNPFTVEGSLQGEQVYSFSSRSPSSARNTNPFLSNTNPFLENNTCTSPSLPGEISVAEIGDNSSGNFLPSVDESSA